MADPDTVRDAAAGTTDSAPAPDKPTGLGTGSWLAAGRRTMKEFKEDFLQDRAAALTITASWPSFRRSWCWYPCWGCSASRLSR